MIQQYGVPKRVLTGMRPTGPLHLGHFVGALESWIPLQDEYHCFFLVADIQALTTHADRPALIAESVKSVVLDWLSVGLDPTRENVHFVLQSGVKGYAKLTELIQMVTPATWVLNNPTLKAELKTQPDATVGFMTYPASQVADIAGLSFDPGVDPDGVVLVPVGEDQLPHLELNNDVVKRFNRIYGPTLSLCRGSVGKVGRLVGLGGGRKMSKSADNAIYLNDSPEEVERKVRGMFTDPKRLRATDKGRTKNNPVFIYHDAFNPNVDEVKDLKKRYRAGKVGDVEVKQKLTIAINNFLDPIRERRTRFEPQAPGIIADVLAQGTTRANSIVSETVLRAEENMGLFYKSIFTNR